MKRSVLVVATLLCCVSILETSCRASNVSPRARKITMESFDRMMENDEQRDIDELHMVESDTSQDKQDEPDENDHHITLKNSQEKELKSAESTDDATTTKYQTADDGETFQKQNFANEEEVDDDDGGDFPSEESVNDARALTNQNENKQEGSNGNEETRDESEDLILKEEKVEDADDLYSEESVNGATNQNENKQEGSSGNEETRDESEDLIQNDGNNEKSDDKGDDNIVDDDSFTRERRWFFSSRRRRTTVNRQRPTSRRRTFASRRRRQTPVTCRGCKGVCDVRTYAGSAFQRRTIRVHSGFVSAMNRINAYANTCGVKIYVTSSFRKVNVPVRGAIVPPASRSNHLVGHAIDMNLIERGRWCNSGCLGRASRWTRGVSCFLKKIRADSMLRWGGDFSRKDPVHIDDGFNWRNSRSYNALYAKLQKNC